MFDREQFTAKAKETRVKRQTPLLHQLIAAVPDMDKLTKSDEWNKFITYLQARVERERKMQVSMQSILSDPNVTNHEELLRAKISFTAALSAEKAFTEAMNLPKQIMESGKSAEELLAKLDTD